MKEEKEDRTSMKKDKIHKEKEKKFSLLSMDDEDM